MFGVSPTQRKEVPQREQRSLVPQTIVVGMFGIAIVAMLVRELDAGPYVPPTIHVNVPHSTPVSIEWPATQTPDNRVVGNPTQSVDVHVKVQVVTATPIPTPRPTIPVCGDAYISNPCNVPTQTPTPNIGTEKMHDIGPTPTVHIPHQYNAG